MAQSFRAAMAKLAVLGHNRNDLVDCSAVVPKATSATGKPATFPATKGPQDLELSCRTERFPTLSTAREYSFYPIFPSCEIADFAFFSQLVLRRL